MFYERVRPKQVGRIARYVHSICGVVNNPSYEALGGINPGLLPLVPYTISL